MSESRNVFQWIGRKNLYGGQFFYVGPFDSLAEAVEWEAEHGVRLVFSPIWPTSVCKGDYWGPHPYELPDPADYSRKDSLEDMNSRTRAR